MAIPKRQQWIFKSNEKHLSHLVSDSNIGQEFYPNSNQTSTRIYVQNVQIRLPLKECQAGLLFYFWRGCKFNFFGPSKDTTYPHKSSQTRPIILLLGTTRYCSHALIGSMSSINVLSSWYVKLTVPNLQTISITF